jgi:hypothetical protein
LKIIVPTDDAIIQKIIEGVAIFAERHTGRELRTNSWLAYANEFQSCFEIRRTPIANIESVQYISSGEALTISSTVYEIDRSGMYPILKLSIGQSWPDNGDTVSDMLLIRFSTRADRRSQEVELSMLKHIADLYENRGDDTLMKSITHDQRASRFYDNVKLPSI